MLIRPTPPPLVGSASLSSSARSQGSGKTQPRDQEGHSGAFQLLLLPLTPEQQTSGGDKSVTLLSRYKLSGINTPYIIYNKRAHEKSYSETLAGLQGVSGIKSSCSTAEPVPRNYLDASDIARARGK